MKLLNLTLITLIFSIAAAAAPQQDQDPTKNKVIDLGDLDVQGELRRPNLFMVESGKHLDDLLSKTAEKRWRQLESSLLQLKSSKEIETLIEEARQ